MNPIWEGKYSGLASSFLLFRGVLFSKILNAPLGEKFVVRYFFEIIGLEYWKFILFKLSKFYIYVLYYYNYNSKKI